MIINSPPNITYPIKVTDLCKRKNDEVARFDNLFYYSFQAKSEESKFEGEWNDVVKSYIATFPSDIAGRLVRWKVAKGDTLNKPGIPLVEIEEPCRHEVQWGQLCANCGQDMTEVSFTTVVKDTDRAPINMTHRNTALRISKDEATRINDSTMRRLLESRKLSLVVDLDQTIIQATVDPTVGDWQKDPTNPNYEAVKDVKCFQLTDEGPVAARCWYYIKFRPGLSDFLANISRLYELHVYTMGTRAYARNIVKLVDPDHTIFGDRVLSRDESGSLTFKTLQRLFPCDTKMVVVIDDRGDVWNWSDNLLKVIPYEFFVGTADINSTFLPKQVGVPSRGSKKLMFNDDPPASSAVPSTLEDSDASQKLTEEPGHSSSAEADGPKPLADDSPETANADTSPSPATDQESQTSEQFAQPVSEVTTTNPESATVEQKIVQILGVDNAESAQEAVIAAQLSDRPLLRRQELLDKADDAESESSNSGDSFMNGSDDHDHHKHRRPLLHDDDTELHHLESHLRNIHRTFFTEFDRIRRGVEPGKVKAAVIPDVADIIADTKIQVLGDVTLVFTGIIPLGVDVHASEISRWAESFGATVLTNITHRVTHVIASKELHTAKLKRALATPSIKVVSVSWLYECFSKWQRVDETPHLLHSESRQEANELETDAGVLLSGSEAGHSGDSEDSDDNQSIVEDLAGNMSEDWKAIQAELDEFLGSSDSDDDENSDDSTSEDGDGEEGEGQDNDKNHSDTELDESKGEKSGVEEGKLLDGPTSTPRAQTSPLNGTISASSKRKRENELGENAVEDETTKSTSLSPNASPDRKRRALGSGLAPDGQTGASVVNGVADAIISSDSATAFPDAASGANTTALASHNQDDDSFDEAALEAEIMAALEADSSGAEQDPNDDRERNHEQVPQTEPDGETGERHEREASGEDENAEGESGDHSLDEAELFGDMTDANDGGVPPMGPDALEGQEATGLNENAESLPVSSTPEAGTSVAEASLQLLSSTEHA